MNSLPADKNRRVLVMDDNRSIHDDFRKILSPAPAAAAAFDATEAALLGHSTDAVRQTQFEVDSGYQGQEGVLLVKKALAAGRPYAMAFMDVRMPPGWDGVETTRKSWELDPDQLIHDLQDALANVKSLSGLLPICAGCKRIRDDKNYWHQAALGREGRVLEAKRGQRTAPQSRPADSLSERGGRGRWRW